MSAVSFNPSDPRIPRYWQHETGGKLANAIRHYLNIDRSSASLTPDEIALIRAYFEQWINSPLWDENPSLTPSTARHLVRLRLFARSIKTRMDIDKWLADAAGYGVDPL